MKKEILHCNFCGSPENSMLYKDNDHLVLCDECGLVYTKYQMGIEDMKDFYGEDYFVSNDSIQRGYEHYFDSRHNINKTFSKRMNLIERHYSNPGKLLDIGCAAGFFLEVGKQRGWDVCGVDISKLCAEYARDRLGVEVRNDLFTDTDFEESTFDLISMWDYLEHSFTPREDIAKARELLRENGLLVIATPDIDSIPARVCRSNWIGIKLDEHFYYFSRSVLIKLLKDMGFEIVQSAYIGKYVSSQILASRLIYYSKFLFNMLNSVLKRAKFSFYCNPFDIMFIIARKRTTSSPDRRIDGAI